MQNAFIILINIFVANYIKCISGVFFLFFFFVVCVVFFFFFFFFFWFFLGFLLFY